MGDKYQYLLPIFFTNYPTKCLFLKSKEISMKSILVRLFCIFSFWTSYSQEIVVNWGNYNEFGNNIYGKEIVYENEASFFVLERESRDVNVFLLNIPRTPKHFINVHDAKKFNQISRHEIIFPYSDKVDYDFALNDIIGVNGQIILLVKATETKTKNAKLIAQKLSPEGKQMGDFYELDEVLSSENKGIFQRKNSGDFDVIISPDKLSFAVVRFAAQEQDADKEIALKILDVDFKLKYGGNIKLPYKSDFYDVSKYRIGNSGEFYLLGKTWKTLETEGLSGKTKTKVLRARDGNPNFNYSFLLFNTQNSQSKEFQIDLKEQFISDITFDISESNNSLICVGFYSADRGGSIKGTFSLSIDLATRRINYSNQKDFSNEFLGLFVSARKAEKLMEGKYDDFELSNFRMDDFIIKPDGSSILVAEQYFVSVTTQSYTDANGFIRTTNTYVYNYNDIIVIYMNAAGGIDWYAKVPKHQSTQDDGGPYSSYVLNVEQNKIYLIFNEHKNNLERIANGDSPKNVGNPKKSVTVLVSIDNAGKMERDLLFSAQEQKLVFRPKSSWYRRDVYNNNKLYLFGVSYGLFQKSKFKFGSIEFKKQ